MSGSHSDTAAHEAADSADRFDFGARVRDLAVWQRVGLFWCAIAYTVFHLVVLNFVALDEWLFRAVHVNAGAGIAFLLYATWSGERRRGIPARDGLAALAALGCTAYIAVELDALIMRTGVITTPADFAVGFVGTLLTIEFARRTAGLVLPLLAAVFIAYAFAGPVMPGVLHHRGFEASHFFSFIYSQEGIFGITTAASSQYIVLFVAFAVFLQLSGAGAYFMDLSFALFGWMRGGPAKVAVVSGVLFGTVSGSSVANVVASGAFTIPMMRRVGYPRASAAAIEATSSTGGQITPPIMGAGAFIMAEVTGIPYADIALAAVLPCLLFYVANFAHVDLEALRHGIRGLPRAELPALRPLLRRTLLLFPLAVLLVLLVAGYSVVAAGTWGIAASVLVMLLSRLDLHPNLLAAPLALLAALCAAGLPVNAVAGLSLGGGAALLLGAAAARAGTAALGPALRGMAGDVLDALDRTARQSFQLVAVCACAGIIVGVLGLTGLGGRFSALILAVAGDSQLLALAFAMVIALVLGMGMPTTAAYAIAASVVAPGLQRVGVDPLAAHMFIFYFAVISAITPPVALASFAAAALAQSNPWVTAFRSVRYGLAAFIVPFLFFYHPEILFRGDGLAILQVGLTATLGVLLLAFASEGWLFGVLGPLPRVLLAAAAFLLIDGGAVTDAAGFGLAGLMVLWRLATRPARAVQTRG
ncbi:TRAP transporter permease [Azospirillum sp. ST 5-10]|uniref:TRAP transporter permease n=1 Tax=unclassified Azospirillum TaxID=2630922 RepID=UPI003F4A359E